MEQEIQESEIVKLKTKKGLILTLTISSKTKTHFIGTDKFGKSVIIPIEDIESMFPVTKSD